MKYKAMLDLFSGPNAVLVGVMALLIVGLVLIVVYAPKEAWDATVCYDGHRYNVDAQGVLHPITTKYGVQTCQKQ